MTLPPRFQFSPSCLQDYVDCRRRFYLRYVRRLAWPAVEIEPIAEHERLRLQGERFHRLVHQAVLGLPLELLERTLQDEQLQSWWDHFGEQLRFLQSQPGQLYPEISLRAPLNGYTLAAKCDLLLVSSAGGVWIFDWKTTQHRPARHALAQSLQTRVYPYLVVRAAAHLHGGQPVQPDQVEMVDWFSDFPQQPERFTYSAAQFAADEAYLTGLIAEIQGLAEDGFTPAVDERRSRFCIYRSLCGRGAQAGSLAEADDLPEASDLDELALDFEQIAEIAF